MRTAATDPQVPGPGLPKPAPNEVAIVHAQIVRVSAGDAGTSAGLFVVTIAASPAHFTEIFEYFGIEDWRADLVYAHCPFSKVDLAAAV